METFPASSYEFVPQITIDDVFHAVQSGLAHRGVIPFENSTNGTVMMSLDLFADRERQLQDILVCGEAYVDVRHCLAGRLPEGVDLSSPQQGQMLQREPSAPSEEDLERFKKISPHIKKLYSHPQAWTQCNRFLASYLKGVERENVTSTSRAAELVAQENPPKSSQLPDAYNTAINADTACISSETAARSYGLDILVSNIQDEANNMTRFFVLCKQHSDDDIQTPIHERANSSDSLDPQHPVIMSTTMDATAMGNPFSSPTFKTLISFTVPHTSPGALAKSLNVFAEHGLNLTSINTRPSLIEPWNYLFFVEMLGRREEHGRGAVNAALRALSGVARGSRWLGSWEMQVDTAED